MLTNIVNRSIRVHGADCGVEAILLGIVTSIGGFLFGYDTGQISGLLLFNDFNKRFGEMQPDGEMDLSPITESLVVSLMSVGALLGALSASLYEIPPPPKPPRANRASWIDACSLTRPPLQHG